MVAQKQKYGAAEDGSARGGAAYSTKFDFAKSFLAMGPARR
jgi:hypothetical protein